MPGGEVMLDGVDLHRAGAGLEEGWVRLPPLRPTFSTAELISGQVWVANGPVAAGQFDRIRLAPGRGGTVPLALHVAAGQWTTLSLEVRVQQAPGRGGLHLELRRARTLSAQ